MLAIVFLGLNNMMDKLAFVLAHFNEDRVYHNGEYYRLKQFDDDTYELEVSISGACGTFESHPAIKFKIMPESNKVLFLSYRDVVVNPMKSFKPESEAELDFVRLAFEQLVDKCNQVKSSS